MEKDKNKLNSYISEKEKLIWPMIIKFTHKIEE